MKKVTLWLEDKLNDFWTVGEESKVSTQLFCKSDNIRHISLKSALSTLIKIQKNKEKDILTLL